MSKQVDIFTQISSIRNNGASQLAYSWNGVTEKEKNNTHTI